MIFFALLTFIIISEKKKDGIIEMDGHRFRMAVFHREPLDIWVALLSSQDLAGHLQANAQFDSAFKLGKGFLKFAYLDTAKNVHVARRLQLKMKQPHFCVFHTSGQNCIAANITARELINIASFYLPDFAEKANSDWIKKDESNAVAILFTEKETTPLLWAAIATSFHKSTIRIGISRDHEFAKTLNVNEFPSIVLHNYTHNIIYQGQNEFTALKMNIKKFGLKRFLKTRSGHGVKPIADFKDVCKGTDKVCIIHAVESLDKRMEKYRKKHTTTMIDFFYGTDQLPLTEIQKGDVYAIWAEQRKFIKVLSLDDLGEIIEEIVSGKAKWTDMKEGEGTLGNENGEDDENDDNEGSYSKEL